MDEALRQMGVQGYEDECPYYGGPRIGRGMRGLGAPVDNEGEKMVAGLGKTVMWGSIFAFGIWYFLLRK